MRILIAIGVRRQKEAGAAGVALNHARELEKLGHSVECWFLDDVLRRKFKSERFIALLFAASVAKRIRRDPKAFDVVNIHAPWGCVYGMVRKYLSVKNIPPYVLTMQGSEERYVRMMKLEDKKGRADHFNFKNRFWHRLYHQSMYDLSVWTADYGAVANREAWICAELKYGRAPGRIRYVPNATEERFFLARQYTDQPSLSLLFVGTWLDRKGVYYLAGAFAIVAKKFPSVRLTVAGCLSPVDEVKRHFSIGIRDRVSVLPFVTREEMPTVYASHEIFVFPSLVEGMPLTLLEAMASGMPVVTTNTSGMADIIEHEFNGLLVQAANVESLAAGIERLCAFRGLREELGKEGQRTAKRYSWESVTRKLEDILITANQTIE